MVGRAEASKGEGKKRKKRGRCDELRSGFFKPEKDRGIVRTCQSSTNFMIIQGRGEGWSAGGAGKGAYWPVNRGIKKPSR